MLYSTERIMTTHAGSLPRPADLREMVVAKANDAAYDAQTLDRRLGSAVAEVVRHQAECGLDSVNDGELSKTNFTDYVRWRIAGYVERPSAGPRRLSITARDETKFCRLFRGKPAGAAGRAADDAGLRREIALYRAGRPRRRHRQSQGGDWRASMSPRRSCRPTRRARSSIGWRTNTTRATRSSSSRSPKSCARNTGRSSMPGFCCRSTTPTCPTGWNCLPEITLPEYRKYAAVRVDALNHALAGIPKDKVRLHVCWGSHHGPHHDDIPLRDIIDLIFRVKAAGSFSIEASNPCHEHEWRVFEDTKLPEGATLIPGVVGHCTDFIEHPDLVAERLGTLCAASSAAKTCSPGPIAGSGHGSAILRSAGPSSTPWPKVPAARPRSCGAAGELPRNMSQRLFFNPAVIVIPAKAGTQGQSYLRLPRTPAFAGVTTTLGVARSL